MPTPTYTALGNITLGSSAASVSFASIPSSFRDLIVITNERHNSSTASGGTLMRFNNDSAGNYDLVYAIGVPNTTATGSGAAANFTGALTSRFTNADGNNGIAHIMDYSATDKQKVVISKGFQAETVQLSVIFHATNWRNTSAITSITCVPENGGSYAANSTFAIYGVIA